MKKYVLLGVIALVMLLAVPAAMAAAPVSVDVSGSLASSLSLSTFDTGACSMTLDVGNNDCHYGMLRVSALRTPWNVATTAIAGALPYTNGWMSNGGNTYLTAPLTFWDGANYINVVAFTESGPYTSTLTNTDKGLDYRQVVDGDDPAGTYGITVTYTVTAV
jgi:hypothetical protein